MIFYFSGTGNSLYATKYIAENCNEKQISISAAVSKGNYEYNLNDNETIGFVFPVYAWAPPRMVIEFINKLKLNNLNNNYTYSIATCGANIGNTMKVLDKALQEKGLALDSAFSLAMPNNYILAGNVDSKDAEARKLEKTQARLNTISSVIKKRKKGEFYLVKGIWTFIGTVVINPMFMKHAIKTEKFYALNNCNGCGICAKVCNCNNITVDKKPKWGNNCSQCLACLHYCPKHAVQYGKNTEKKGRYTNPNINVNEMMR